jgi:hypothetical protein
VRKPGSYSSRWRRGTGAGKEDLALQVTSSLRNKVVFCNIPGLGVTKREETDVCIAFMHRKSRKFSRFQIKLVKETEISLDLMELKYIIKSSTLTM